MEEQARIRALAVPQLVAACNGGIAGASVFRPRIEDYARVFTGDLQARIAHFEALWSKEVEITAPPRHTEIIVTSARGSELPTVTWFPGGYQMLANIVPIRIWIAWKYVVPGETLGMAYDGLVWLDDRFAWFPKPWRVPPSAAHPLYRE